MKKGLALFLLGLGLSAVSWAEYPFPDIYKKFEFSLFGGWAVSQVKGTTDYADTWSHLYLTRVSENTTIGVNSKGGLSFGAAFAYFFNSHFGVQAAAGLYRSGLQTTSDIGFDFTWSSSVGGGSYSKSSGGEGTGHVQTIPLSLNLIGKIIKSNFEIFFSGGPTLFFNQITAETAFGFGFTKTETVNLPTPLIVQYVDALGVGLEFAGKTWLKFGANLGAGLVYKFSEMVGLSLEARYFLCPAAIFDWDFVLGSYDGLFYSQAYPILQNVPFTEDDVTFIRDNSTLRGLSVNPSFFQVLVGLKIFFGN